MVAPGADGLVYGSPLVDPTPPLHELLELRRPDWHADAECREHPELTWFPERGEDSSAALAVCARCLVRDECRTAGASEGHGIWGGIGEHARPRQPTMKQRLILGGAEHATQRGYRAGCRCDDCTAAHAAYYRERRSA